MSRHAFCVIVVLVSLVSGCASFQKNEIAKVEKMPDTSQYQNKPKVYFEIEYYMGEPDKAGLTPIASMKPKVQGLVEKVIKEDSLFSEYTFDAAKKGDMNYTIRLQVYNHGNAGAAAVMGFLSGFTFGVIPAAATDNYTLKASIVDSKGDTTGSLRNKDSVTTWIGIWFIPAMSHTPEKAVTATLENQIKAALKDAIDAKNLQYSENKYFSVHRYL